MRKPKNQIYTTTTCSAGSGCLGGCGVLAVFREGKRVKPWGSPVTGCRQSALHELQPCEHYRRSARRG